MKFRDILENNLKSITFVDIDETLFKTSALIYVIKDGNVLKKLTNTEFNTYKLKDGESFDFREFADSEIFANTSEPIHSMIDKINAMFKNISAKGSDMRLLTARADFNNKEKFIEFLRSYGIKAGHYKDGDIHVIRAGNKGRGSSAVYKKEIINEFLATKKYYKVRLYDDAVSNLNSFLELKEIYTDIIFEAYIIKHGKVSKYK